MRKSIAAFASSVLPGLFMVGYVVGTGTVTTMSAAGASFGMSLLWTCLLASVFTHVMVVAISENTIRSGTTLLTSFRRHFGAPVTLFIMAGLMVTQIASVIGVTGIVAEIVQEWSRPLTPSGEGVPTLWVAAAAMAMLLWLFWGGRHRLFLRFLSALVGLMGVAFVVTASIVPPPPLTVIQGLIPRIPETGDPHLLIAGMVGTTMAGVCLFSRSIIVHEEGWRAADLGVARRDSLISVFLLFIINGTIMACAAGTMLPAGLKVERAIDMVQTLEPLAGRLASTGFVVGIVAAGLSSLFPNYLLGPWLLSDFFGIKRDLSRPAFRALVVATASTGLIIPLFGGSPVGIMIASQALSPLIMPLMVLLVLILLRRLEPPRAKWKPSHWGLLVTFGFSVYMAVVALIGFVG